MDDKRRIVAHNAQIGGIGHGWHVEGGIHLHREVIVYDGVRSFSAGTLLDACQAQVQSMLYAVGSKYSIELYVNRAIEQEISSFFDTPLDGPAPNCFLIVAPAGSGKTNLLCDLARARAPQQPVVLLMGGNTYLSGTTGLLGAVKQELEAASPAVAFRSAGDSLHTLHRLAEEMDRDALLLLDAINEHDRPATMRRALEDLLRKTRGRRFKLVITCRDYFWGLFRGRFWEGATVNDLPADDGAGESDVGAEAADFSRFAADEHERALKLYLEHYDISGRPVGDAADQCRHPLLLRFFCEAYRGQEIGQVEDIRLKELFDHYWDQKVTFIAEHMIEQGDERLHDYLKSLVGDYLLDMASFMLHQRVRAIPLEELAEVTGYEEEYGDPHSFYGRIRDEFVILEEKERGRGRHKVLRVAFAYEEFMEYVMACSLVRDWDKENLGDREVVTAIEALVRKYRSFSQILGVMVYLSPMLKERRGLELWSLLLKRGDRWRKIVFGTIRKLPEDQLDVGVFTILQELLAAGDSKVREQVLNTMKSARLRRVAPASVVKLVVKLALSEEKDIRHLAWQAMRHTERDRVVPVLAEAVIDGGKNEAMRALMALRLFWSHPRVPEVASRALQHSDYEVQRKAVEALVGLGERAGDWLDHLARRLDNPDPVVRRRAIQALWRIWHLPDPLVHGEFTDLKHLDELTILRAIRLLVAMLKDEREGARASASRDLGWMLRKLSESVFGKPPESNAVFYSQMAFRPDGSSEVRRSAAEALGKLGASRSVEPLFAALGDPSLFVRRSAADALWELGYQPVEGSPRVPEAQDEKVQRKATEDACLDNDKWYTGLGLPLVAALGDSDKGVREAVVDALKEPGCLWLVDSLLAALENNHFEVRANVADALGDLTVPRLAEALTVAREDINEQVRLRAVETLREIECAKSATIKDTDKGARAGLAEALRVLDRRRAAKPLITALRDSDEESRARAADTLGELGDRRAVRPLIGALKDPDARVRARAAWALGAVGSRHAVKPLVVALKDADKRVRAGAAAALGALGARRAVRSLVAALQDSDEGVRARAAEALGEIGHKQAVEPLIVALRGIHAGVHVRASPEELWGVQQDLAPWLSDLDSSDLERSLRAYEEEEK